MDLKTFVSESITQIAQGIQAAQTDNPGISICPKVAKGKNGLILVEGSHLKEMPQLLSFDVAVTVVDSSSGSEGGKMRVLGVLCINGTSDSTHQNSTVSRIKFDIPLIWRGGA